MRKTDYAFWAYVCLASLAGATTLFNVSRTYSATSPNAEIYKQLDLFGDVLERVRADYVDRPDDQLLIENAINGMLSALDPHSAYLNAKSYKDMQVQTQGKFGGLGIEVTMDQGVIKVVSPIDDTPASKAGLLANDLITHLDNEQVTGLTLEQAVERMRGPVGTPILLTVVRKGMDAPFDVKVTRDIIQIHPVKWHMEAGGEIGYIKISQFNELTQNDLVKALDAMRKDGGGKRIKAYIIDLRNNPGGLLDQAIAVSSDFIEKGEIVLTKGRNPEETQRSNAHGADLTDGKRIVVLINGGSASASEIVAGALQDHKRATLIGTRSFGKGSVQTIIPLGGNNGALRLTTARYYTPSGRSIQAKGIDPDRLVEEELPPELQGKERVSDRGEASLRGHLKSEAKDPSKPGVKPGDQDSKDAAAPDDAPAAQKDQSGSSAYVAKDPEKDTQLQFAIKFLMTASNDAAPAPRGDKSDKGSSQN